MTPTRQMELISAGLGVTGLTSLYASYAFPGLGDFGFVVGVFALFVSNRAFAKAAVYAHIDGVK